MKIKSISIILASVLFLAHCSMVSKSSSEPRTEPDGETAQEARVFQNGIASWYGPDFHGKRTANGEVYDMNKLTAAHKELPFHTLVSVENLDNNKRVVVRINDRGPFIKDRIIDLSKEAAKRIDMLENGTSPVRLRIISASQMSKENLSKEKTNTAAKSTATVTKPETKPEVHTKFEPEIITESEINSDTIRVTPETPETEVTNGFYLQAGAFSSWGNAGRMVEQLKNAALSIEFSIKYLDGFYKVISKPFATREEAEILKHRMQNKGFSVIIKK